MSDASPDFFPSDETFDRGAALLARLSPEGVPPPWQSFADVAPVLGRSVGTAFGAIIDRPGLDLRTREIVTVAVLATLGGCEPQVAFHVGAALRAGATAPELVEALTQVSVYAGVPRALNAVAAARPVFEAGGVSGAAAAPRAVVVTLLEALRTGDEATAAGLLTAGRVVGAARTLAAALAVDALSTDEPLAAGDTVYVPLRLQVRDGCAQAGSHPGGGAQTTSDICAVATVTVHDGRADVALHGMPSAEKGTPVT